MSRTARIEYAENRKMRARNKVSYRVAHWPIWIAVFFIAPGPMTFALFAYGATPGTLAWLGVVLIATATAGFWGKLPGVEPQPYILRFTEDKPNPLYRRICYTFAWNAVLNFALMNLTGLLVSVFSGRWILKQIYTSAYFPLAIAIGFLGLLGWLPRVGRSTAGEGVERRYFYGSVWAACCAQPVLGALWLLLPRTRTADVAKLLVFLAILAFCGLLARGGYLPRTRRIVPGDIVVAD